MDLLIPGLGIDLRDAPISSSSVILVSFWETRFLYSDVNHNIFEFLDEVLNVFRGHDRKGSLPGNCNSFIYKDLFCNNAECNANPAQRGKRWINTCVEATSMSHCAFIVGVAQHQKRVTLSWFRKCHSQSLMRLKAKETLATISIATLHGWTELRYHEML